jgi:hypothetical protein
MTKSSGDIQDLADMKFRIFGQAVSKYMIERLFCEDYNGGFYLKGG